MDEEKNSVIRMVKSFQDLVDKVEEIIKSIKGNVINDYKI